MSHEAAGGDDEMILVPGHPLTAAPLDDENLLGEILVRLPPLPSSLIRASAVSRHWWRLAADRGFLRRFRTHHPRPPILGVFEMRSGEVVFTPLLNAPDRIPRERFSMGFWARLDGWALLGCRHGRVLSINQELALVLVFAPISGDRRLLFIPSNIMDGEYVVANGAVLCAAGDEDQGHVHGDCHSSPFKVVLVAARKYHPVLAQVYSSEIGDWGDPVLMACPGIVSKFPSTLIGNALYWLLQNSQDSILKFDLGSQTLAVVKRPVFSGIHDDSIRIIRGEHGGVGLALFSYPRFQRCERMLNSHGDATWVVRMTGTLHSRHPYAMSNIVGSNIVGYSEDGDAVILRLSIGGAGAAHTYILQLESMKVTHLKQSLLEISYHPFAYFYTPGTVRGSSTSPTIEPPQQQSNVPAIEPPHQ